MGIILALVSSALWGIADFTGGSASRRLPAMTVVLASQTVGLVAVALLSAITGAWSASLGYLPWAIAAGLVGVTGLLAFYRALASGTMGVVSPIAALGVVVPVAAGLASGDWPSVIVGIGFVLAVAGVVAASGPERAAGRSLTPVFLAVVAAVCFGATLLFIARASVYSAPMTMVAMRVASVTLLAVVLVVRRRSPARRSTTLTPPPRSTRVGGRIWAIVAVAGLFDVSANLTFGWASTAGALTIVAILGSLYPAVTVLLARVIHQETLTRVQIAGVSVALVGVAIIAGWS